MSGITTHVLDTSRGAPAAGVSIRLERHEAGGWGVLADRTTDADGRVRDLLPGAAAPGRYQLTFGTGEYFAGLGQAAFFPSVTVAFDITDGTAHYHVPLLLSPYGYSTYRGS